MDYNTTRSLMMIPEYGRNVQNMIELLPTIEDRYKRTKAAYFIINVMAQLSVQKDSADFKQKLWDHLHIISRFTLDIDSPFPPPSIEKLQRKPSQIRYSTNRIRYGHYGQHVFNMIQKAIEFEEGEEKEALVNALANYMKKSFLTWNRDSVNDGTIAANLEELSKGRLSLTDESKLTPTNEILARNNINTSSYIKKKKFVPRRDNTGFQKKGPRFVK
ncbi:MAG: DUF4290 domain-containing protein [Bacteroidales bacterium]|nr:DUF4290 domain-containing protein [Bacteroidales bacterium]